MELAGIVSLITVAGGNLLLIMGALVSVSAAIWSGKQFQLLINNDNRKK